MYVIGQILKSLRENKALQLSEVQEGTGIDATNISRIENGHRLPTIKQIELLAELYDVSTETLIAERESDKILEEISYYIRKQTIYREQSQAYRLDIRDN